MSKAVEKKISDLITGEVEAAGYELVRVQITGGAKFATLQIMADRKDGAAITVDDCAAISELVLPIIEADPALAERYGLEVSSPGIDRPLVRMRDYERYKGHVVKLELKQAVNGQRRFQGKIGNVKGEEIEIIAETGTSKVLFDNIEKAKLLLTDELLKAAASGRAS